jgi:hypothetical protein
LAGTAVWHFREGFMLVIDLILRKPLVDHQFRFGVDGMAVFAMVRAGEVVASACSFFQWRISIKNESLDMTLCVLIHFFKELHQDSPFLLSERVWGFKEITETSGARSFNLF